jgi:hypothetical protein
MQDYNQYYNQLDTALLADVIIPVRALLYQEYGTDILCYPSLASWSWSTALLYTNARLQLPLEVCMTLFVRQGIRGGICQQAIKLMRANNPASPHYDATKPTSHLVFYDVSGLYGYTMSKFKLPVGPYNFIENPNVTDILEHPDEAEFGYIIECMLEYPEALKAISVDFPLAPHHRVIEHDELSDFQKRQIDALGIKAGRSKKLILDHLNKDHYILDYRLAKLYVSLGMRMTRCYRALVFKQEAFLSSFVNRNHELRLQSTTPTASMMFKLANNSLYGKCLANMWKYKNIKLALTDAAFDKNNRKLTVKNISLLAPDVAVFEHHLDEVRAFFPTAVGLSILDLSKAHMYNTWYNGFKKHLPQAYLGYIDTDSILALVTTENFLEEMSHLREDFLDCSNFDKSHPLYDDRFKSVLGRLRSEKPRCDIIESATIRAKMYSIKTTDQASDVRKLKGIKRSVVKKEITHEKYLQVLRENSQLYCSQKQIQSVKFVPYSVNIRKISLSAYDDKRFSVDALRSVPHGCDPALAPPLSYFNVDVQ